MPSDRSIERLPRRSDPRFVPNGDLCTTGDAPTAVVVPLVTVLPLVTMLLLVIPSPFLLGGLAAITDW